MPSVQPHSLSAWQPYSTAGIAAAKAAGGNTGAAIAAGAVGGTAGAVVGSHLGNEDGCIEANAFMRITLRADLAIRSQ